MKNVLFFTFNMVYSDRSEIDLSDATIIIQNCHSDQKLSWKNWWSYYVAVKWIVSKLSKISNPKFDSTNWRLNADSVKISCSYLL